MKRCIAILTLTISVALCANEASAISPEMHLWLDLVDAGYTADEAFDIVEMVVENDQGTSGIFNYDFSYEKGNRSGRNGYRCYSCGICGD